MKSNRLTHIIMIPFLFIISGGHLSLVSGEELNLDDTRPPAFAGRFYSGSPNKLRSSLENYLERVPPVKPAGTIMAAIAPHAGYMFSGQVAAYTYKLLSHVSFDTLIIIGHDTHRSAVAFTCPVNYFETPLGKVPVDLEMTQKMQAFDRGIRAHRRLHTHEHTIELQLPFLQVLKKKCKIVPVLFGNPTEENCRILSQAILAASGDSNVFVLASTDLSHYPSYQDARRVDHATLEALNPLGVGKLFSDLSNQEKTGSIPNMVTTMCAKGGVGTAILFAKARGANHAQFLHYANSGDVPSGDKGRVVGYGSVLFVNKKY
ncbi:AmmeMemoRadiSam system protein B [Thermodesulfobacteriota bacterium]